MRTGRDPSRFLFRKLQELAVAEQIGHTKIRHACLPGTEELAGSPQAQVEFRDLESIGRLHRGVEALLGFRSKRLLAVRHEHAKRFCGAAPDAPTQLVQL